MTTLVLTILGDDRAGLVSDLSRLITDHGGNWTTSRLAELAGKFAGIVQVDIDDARAEQLTAALVPLNGLLDITVQAATERSAPQGTVVDVDIVADDRPGIVREITEVISRGGGSIEELVSEVIEAPHSGGLLFTAHAVIRVNDPAATAALRSGLEAVAGELMVEITFGS